MENTAGTTQPKVGGEIAYYHLEEWWLEAFTEEERIFIRNRHSPISMGTLSTLDSGHIHYFTEDDPTQFLYTLANWLLRKGDDPTLRQRMVAKANELAALNHFQRPGYLRGRHHTTYMEEVKELKRQDRLHEVKALLKKLIPVIKAEGKLPSPTWCEHHLGIVERKLARKANDASTPKKK